MNKKNRTPLIAIAQKLLLNKYKTQEKRNAIFTIATLIIQKVNNASYFDMQDYKQHTATHYLEKTKVKHDRDVILSKMADAFIVAIEEKQTQLNHSTTQ